MMYVNVFNISTPLENILNLHKMQRDLGDAPQYYIYKFDTECVDDSDNTVYILLCIDVAIDPIELCEKYDLNIFGKIFKLKIDKNEYNNDYIISETKSKIPYVLKQKKKHVDHSSSSS
jgi:hypothetical protein